MGRVRALTYPDTEVVTYAYNGFGDVETIQGVKNSVTTDYVKDVDYNAAGQITFIQYGNNVTSDYTYNPQTLRLDKILTKKSDGVTKLQDLSYQFDSNGNVTHISDLVNAMSQDFTYDDLNRLIQAVGSAYGTQTFQYNAVGNMTAKAGLNLSYGVSGAKPHAVTSVTGTDLPSYCGDNQGPCTFDYDANGNMTRRASDTLSFDSENRLKETRAYEAAQGTQNYTLHEGWNLISFTYLPDDKSIASVLSSLTFGADYDQISYYDPAAGSWKHFVNDGDFNDFTAFEYGKAYEIHVTKAGGVSFSVTGKSSAVDITTQIKAGENFIGPGVKEAAAVGTVLAGLTFGTDYSDIKRLNASTQTFELYSQGAFSNFEPGKGYILVGLRDTSFNYGKTEKVTTFVYDATGSRVKKVENNSTTIYLGKDYDVQGSLKTKYIFLGSRRIATKDSGGTLLFIHDDHISSSNVVTDSSGNQAALYEYDPYGTTVTHTGTADLKHRYTGQEADDSTALYYYNARYYDPQIGRFVSSDTIVPDFNNPQDLNRYSYVNNNPVKFVDPTGHFKFKDFLKSATAVAVSAAAAFASYGALVALTPMTFAAKTAAIVTASAAMTEATLQTKPGQQLTKAIANNFFDDMLGMKPKTAQFFADLTVRMGLNSAYQAGLGYMASDGGSVTAKNYKPGQDLKVDGQVEKILETGKGINFGSSPGQLNDVTKILINDRGEIVGAVGSGAIPIFGNAHTGIVMKDIESIAGRIRLKHFPNMTDLYGTWGISHTAVNSTLLEAGYRTTVTGISRHTTSYVSSFVYGPYGGGLTSSSAGAVLSSND